MEFLYLSSQDSSMEHPSNTWYDFIVDLPRRLNLLQTWGCALLELDCYPQLETDIFVYCDILNYSYIDNSLAPVLRKITRIPSVFTFPYFVSIKNNLIERIGIYIRAVHTGEKPLETVNKTVCTLGLRQCHG